MVKSVFCLSLIFVHALLWAYDPSTADIAKVVGDKGGLRGGLGCGVDVGTGLDP